MPLTVSEGKELAWDDTADVVVVGFGGAGAVAAIQAREVEATVIAIDRFAGGGATAYSGGVIYAGGTRYLRDNGYDDNVEEMYKYLEAEGSAGAVGSDTLRRFCEGSNADIEWLAGLGVRYGGKAYEEKTAFPPDNYYLYYSGNEKMPAYAAVARPAPRGHRVAVNGPGGGEYFSRLREAALAKGTRLITHAPVTRLVLDAAGKVLGVEINPLPPELTQRHQILYKVVHPWRPFNHRRAEKAIAAAKALEEGAKQRRYIRALGGVILCTGGYNNNYEMMRQHHPALTRHYDKLLRLGSMGDDGSGIQLGESVGGKSDLMQNISVARTLVPPNVFAHGIAVNANGKRFFNEAAYAMLVGGAILEQPDAKAWLILEAKDFWTGVYKSFFPGGDFMMWGLPALLNIFGGGTRRGGTLQSLARRINVDPAGLVASIAEFNAAVQAGQADPFGKLPELLFPVAEGPFYAVNLSMDNKFAPAQSITMGGLMVDGETGNVKRADGSLIRGLYAAGRAAVGVCSNGFVSGVTIADTVFSGRRAGRDAAARATSPQAAS